MYRERETDPLHFNSFQNRTKYELETFNIIGKSVWQSFFVILFRILNKQSKL